MFTFTKDAGETIAGLGIDFSTRFPAGTTITGAVSAPSGITVSPAQIDGGVVFTTVSGGSVGSDYLLMFTATGSDGSVRNARLQIRVRT